MNALFAVAGQELGRHRRAFAAAPLIGLAAAAIPWLEGWKGQALVDGRDLVTQVAALSFSALLAVALGWALWGSGEPASGGLRFCFARPLPGIAIWGGRLLAALAFVWGGGLLVLAPNFVLALATLQRPSLGGLSALWPDEPRAAALLALPALLLLLLLANATGVVARARSAWLLLDFGGALAFAGLAGSALARLRSFGLDRAHETATVALGLALGTSLLVASAAQVLVGRCESGRAHRAFSLTLWLICALAAGGGELLSRWYVAPGPGDLTAGSIHTQSTASGDWLELGGVDRWRPGLSTSFLVDSLSGRAHLLTLANDRDDPTFPFAFIDNLALAADGRSAVWLAVADRRYVVQRLDLTTPNARPQLLALGEPLTPYGLTLSDDGTLLAARVSRRQRLAVFEVASGREVASAELPQFGFEPTLRFTADRRLRIAVLRPADRSAMPGEFGFRLAALELDPATGQLENLGELARSEIMEPPRFSANASQLVVRAAPVSPTFPAGLLPGQGRLARTFLVSWAPGLPAVAIAGGQPVRWAGFLPDGRVLWSNREDNARTLHLGGATGDELRRWSFPGAAWLTLGHVVEGDLLVSSGGPLSAVHGGSGWRAWRVPLAGGEPQPLADGLLALGPWFYAPLSTGLPLFLDERGTLVRLDLAHGTLSALALHD